MYQITLAKVFDNILINMRSCINVLRFGLSVMVGFFDLEDWGVVMSWEIGVLLFE